MKINVGKLQRNHSLVLISSDEAFDAYPIRRVC
jgi:PIN domain nuclease of toxin-antitoxin system